MRKKPTLLLDEIRHLVRSPRERANLAEKLHKEAAPDAAARLAAILLQIAKEREQPKKNSSKKPAAQRSVRNQRPTRHEKRMRKVEKHKTGAKKGR